MDLEACNGDGICVDICPENVLTMVDDRAATVAERAGACIECGPARRASAAFALLLLTMACARPRQEAPVAQAQPEPGSSSVERVEVGLVPMSEEAEPQWDRRATLADRMRHYGVPGVGVAVIDDFAIAWARGYGALRTGGEEPVTPETLFHAGSVAKSLSAAAALTLVEEGRLDLDRDVQQDLVSWQIPDSDLTRHEKVTLRRLLSHSAGIQDGFTDRSSADALPGYLTPEGTAPRVSLQELLDAAPGVDVDGPARVVALPGSRYRYANADYAILELLLADVTGKPFARFMEETVLGPLGMASSTFEQPLPADLLARAATEHDLAGQPFAGNRLHFPLRAAGSLWTTPSDLARFAVELVRAYRGESERLLSPAMAKEMLTGQIEIEANPLAEAAGLGLNLAGEGEGLYLVHTGGTWGSTSILWAYPATGQGVVIMTNSATGSLLRFEILLAIAREHGWPLEP